MSSLSHITPLGLWGELIINKVCKRISLEKPHLPIFTIHDSVVTIQGSENYVSRILKEEIKKATGLNVKLGLEYWNL